MALIPTRYTRHVLEDYQEQDLFTEGQLRATMTEGWFSHPSQKDETLISRTLVVLNQFDAEMHKVVEEWSYQRPGGPPYKYQKEIWSKAFVPVVNPGRALKLMQEETIVYWTFAPFAKDALAHRREVNAYVVYNLKPNADLDSEGEQKLTDRGQKADGATEVEKRYHVDSAQLWSEAARNRTNVEKVDANQTAKWVKNVIYEETQMTEEPDRYTVWGTRKFALRPDDVEQIGPTYHRKSTYKYRLPVPVDPPEISVNGAGDEGVRITIRGGGARINIPLVTRSRFFNRGPEFYRVFRKKTAEADRDPVDDPWGIWDNAPTAEPRRSIIVNTFVGDYSGTPDPNEGLPTQTSYTEPHDPSPYVDDSWRSVGQAPNEAEDPDNEVGYATIYDADVTNGSTYVYAAVAVVQDTESVLSNQESHTYSGGEPRTYSITVRENPDGSLDGDIIMPYDPGVAADPDVGDSYDYEIPAAVSELGRPNYPADYAQLTASAVVDTAQETFSITPPNNPEAWAPGRDVCLTDIVGPGKPDASGISRPYRVWGNIVSQSGSTVVIENIAADGHTYPIGASVEPQAEDYIANRIWSETGDGMNPTMEALVIAVGMRQGLKYRNESFDITLECKVPLLDLALGTWVYITGVSWDAWGNDLWLQSEIDEVAWVLKGWENTVERDSTGKFVCNGTKLRLGQR
jgi:hypothetical protein